MDYYYVRVKTDFASKVFVDFELAQKILPGQFAKFNLRKGEHHFRIESGNPLVYFEDTLFLDYDRIIQLSFKDIIQNLPESIEDSLWVSIHYDSNYHRYGLIDVVSGNWVLAPRYHQYGKQIDDLNNSKTHAKFRIVENGTLTLLSKSGRILEKKYYDHIETLSLGNSNYFITIVGGNCGLISADDGYIKEITKQEYDEILEDRYESRRGFFNVRKGDCWGCINNEGETVLPLEYEDAFEFKYHDELKNWYAFAWNLIKGEQQLINSSNIPVALPDLLFRSKNHQILQNGLMIFCEDNEDSEDNEESEDIRFGILDTRTCKVLVSAKYEDFDFCANNDFHFLKFKNNGRNFHFLKVKNNGRWGYINTDGVELINAAYDYTSDFVGKYAIVSRSRDWWVIDEVGNRVSEVISGDSIMSYESHDERANEISDNDIENLHIAKVYGGPLPEIPDCYPWDHMYIVRDDSLRTFGLINLKNAAVIKSQFSRFEYFKAGIFQAYEVASTPCINWRRSFDDCGHDLFPEFEISGLNEARKTFLVSQHYPVLLEECKVDWLKRRLVWCETIYKISDSMPLDSHVGIRRFDYYNKYWIIDSEGRNISLAKFDDVKEIERDFVIVQNNYYIVDIGDGIIPDPSKDYSAYSLKGLIGWDGKMLIPIMYQEIERLQCDLVKVTDLNGVQETYWVHQNRCIKVDFNWSNTDCRDSDYRIAHFSDGYNLVDDNGVPVFAINYDKFCDNICPHLYVVMHNNKYGVLSDRGETIISLIYDTLQFKSEGCIVVTNEGKKGVIDINGKIVVPISYEEVFDKDYDWTGQIGVVLNGRLYFINSDGAQSEFPGIESPDAWISIIKGEAIFYSINNEFYLKVRGRDVIKLESVDVSLWDYVTDYSVEYFKYREDVEDMMQNHPLTKYVKALQAAQSYGDY